MGQVILQVENLLIESLMIFINVNSKFNLIHCNQAHLYAETKKQKKNKTLSSLNYLKMLEGSQVWLTQLILFIHFQITINTVISNS